MSINRLTGFLAIVLSITMVCAVLSISFVPSDKFQKTYICYDERGECSEFSNPQKSVSLVPKPIKEASFEATVSIVGWLNSERISAFRNDTELFKSVRFADSSAIFNIGPYGFIRLLCRLLI